MTTGTTMGEISTLISTDLPGKSDEVRPTAANVPRVVASKVAAGATIKLFCSEVSHTPLPKNSSYQRSENDLIGYSRKVSAENDSGTITSSGDTRKIRIITQKMRKPQNQMRSIGEA